MPSIEKGYIVRLKKREGLFKVVSISTYKDKTIYQLDMGGGSALEDDIIEIRAPKKFKPHWGADYINRWVTVWIRNETCL